MNANNMNANNVNANSMNVTSKNVNSMNANNMNIENNISLKGCDAAFAADTYKGIYVHTPFCVKKCFYCDFPSYSGFSPAARGQYVKALLREIELRAFSSVSENATIYFGGGTPTVLSVSEIGEVVAALKKYGFWQLPLEATIEANPGTVDSGDLQALRLLGFDRISFGVQSFNDNELRAIGRIHSAKEAKEAILMAKEAGFKRINLDLMSDLPEQTVNSFRSSLEQALELGISHISAYSLILEEGTLLTEMVEKGRVVLPDEDAALEMYLMPVEILGKAGLKKYEISNFAVPGQESLHNLNYWHYENYAGFGTGACTFYGNKRMTGTFDVKEYTEGLTAAASERISADGGSNLSGAERGEVERCGAERGDVERCDVACCGSESAFDTLKDIYDIEELSFYDMLAEFMFMGLRTTKGVSLNEASLRFGIDVLEEFRQETKQYFDLEMLEVYNPAAEQLAAGKDSAELRTTDSAGGRTTDSAGGGNTDSAELRTTESAATNDVFLRITDKGRRFSNRIFEVFVKN